MLEKLLGLLRVTVEGWHPLDLYPKMLSVRTSSKMAAMEMGVRMVESS